MKAFNSELEEGVDKANEALEAKLQQEKEDEAKAKALVESAKQVKKIKDHVEKLVKNMSLKKISIDSLVKGLISMQNGDYTIIDITVEDLTKILDSFIDNGGCPKENIDEDDVKGLVENKPLHLCLFPRKMMILKKVCLFLIILVTCQDKDEMLGFEELAR